MDKENRRKIANFYGEEEIALDETVVKANKKRYYVYSAVDVERNELMKVYPTRNWLVTKSFIKEVLKYCEKQAKIRYR